MYDEGEVVRTVRATLARLGIEDTALATSKTLHCHVRSTEVAGSSLELAFSASDLVTVRELGRGGMGIVHLAEQRSLGREVAVKTSTSTDSEIVGALVREARIMGELEHPSLVPVHSLGVDANGGPMLVMKRIDGVTWRELLDAPEHAAWTPLLAGHGDRLRAQIDILVQVSRALAFAHDRGIVHRDLKPENVMIGRFGEVYVLDWGAALRLSERAAEPAAVVGTPGYLSPEMASGDPNLVDPRTDVYLLGGTLYEVLAGRMPHDSPNAIMALVHAVSGEMPPLPETAPKELAALVRKAMAADKDDRPDSAESFRAALAHFLVSRDADIVAADARQARARAAVLIEAEGPSSVEAYRALVEARFGFASAHRMRPDDDSVRAELDASVTQLVAREIASRNPVAARALLSELLHAPEDLVRRIDALDDEVRQEHQAAEELAKAKREADTSKMVRPLSITIALVVALAVGIGSFFALKAAGSDSGFPVSQSIAADTAIAVLFGAGVIAARRTLFATMASRRLVATYAVCSAGVYASDIVSFALGRTTSEAAAHSITVLCVGMAVLGVTGTPRALAALPVTIGCVVAILALPRFAPVFAMIAGVVAFSVIFVRSFRMQGGA